MDMEFRDGKRALRVRVEDGPLGDDGFGLGMADWPGKAIRIAGDSYLAPDQRLPTLAHELSHWFEWDHGKPPEDDEQRADWMASYATWVVRELARQGGEEALKRLKPGGGTMTPIEALELGGSLHADEPYATECLGCGSMIGSASVVRSVVCPHESGRPVVWMACLCGDCGELWRWACAAEGGRSTAAVVDGPVRVVDRLDVARFAMKFPRQAGVVMVG